MSSHYTKQGQQIVREYRVAGGAWPAKSSEIAEWAVGHEMWDIGREDKLRVCANFIAESMRQERLEDTDGHRVRAKVPAKTRRSDGEQGTFWDDIRTATPEFMRISVAQRRNSIVYDCRQLSNDVRFFNQIHPEIEPIQLVLDFTRDVEEMESLKSEKAA